MTMQIACAKSIRQLRASRSATWIADHDIQPRRTALGKHTIQAYRPADGGADQARVIPRHKDGPTAADGRLNAIARKRKKYVGDGVGGAFCRGGVLSVRSRHATVHYSHRNAIGVDVDNGPRGTCKGGVVELAGGDS